MYSEEESFLKDFLCYNIIFYDNNDNAQIIFYFVICKSGITMMPLFLCNNKMINIGAVTCYSHLRVRVSIHEGTGKRRVTEVTVGLLPCAV